MLGEHFLNYRTHSYCSCTDPRTCRSCLASVCRAVLAYDVAAASVTSAEARRVVLLTCAAELCAAPKARVGAHACAAVLADCTSAGHAPESCCAVPAVATAAAAAADVPCSSLGDAVCARAARVLLAATRARDEPAALHWAMLLFEWCSTADLRALWALLVAERPAPLRNFYRGAVIVDLDASGGRLFFLSAVLVLCRAVAAATPAASAPPDVVRVFGERAPAATSDDVHDGGGGVVITRERVAAAYAPEARVVVPDYALDKHTHRGKRLGRGFDHFWTVACAVHPAAEGVPDAYREAARAVYLAQESANGTSHRTKHMRARLATHFAAVKTAFAFPGAGAVDGVAAGGACGAACGRGSVEKRSRDTRSAKDEASDANSRKRARG